MYIGLVVFVNAGRQIRECLRQCILSLWCWVQAMLSRSQWHSSRWSLSTMKTALSSLPVWAQRLSLITYIINM